MKAIYNKTCIEKAQTLIKKWCTALWITGGCLRPEKCWWYSIGFSWDKKGKWQYKTSKETGGIISIPDHKQREQIIKQQEVSKGKEGLGVKLAPDGNKTDQFDKILNKAQDWARKVKKQLHITFCS